MDEDLKKGMKIIGCVVLGFFIFCFLMGSFNIITTGERGVVISFGSANGRVMNEGLNFKFPFFQSIERFSVQIKKDQVKSTAASKDLQNVNTEIAINYKMNESKLVDIYRNIGVDIKSNIIDPSIQEAVKSITSKYTAEELITKRESVREDIQIALAQKLKSYGVEVDQINIVNFKFSNSFEDAIERKVTAEQNALAAKNKLEQVKFEADQQIAKAKGKAEAMRVESQAINSNKQILELRAIERWNGVLPLYVGSGSVPFINVK
jgi:regulator of protease activity HflC (stomatin/prohibitin superfamily)